MNWTTKNLLNKALGATVGFCISMAALAADFSPNFKNTDINEFITTVGRQLNKTIIVDPSVRGKVNVRSYDLLNEEQYYQFFLSVLDVYGFAVVDMPNGVTKIIRAKDAKGAAIPVVDQDGEAIGDEMVTRVVPVRNVSVRELAPLLRQLNDNAGGGNVVHYDPSNVIMLTGRAAVVNRLVEIIRRVDKAGDQEVDIIRLRYASAAEMVRIISSLTATSGGGKGGASTNLLQPKVVADERTNSVVVSGEPSVRARIVTLVEKLDSELETYGNTRVFYLKYAKAADLVGVLKGVSETVTAESAGGGKKSSSSRNNFSIEAHEDTNSVVITAQPDTMRALESVIAQLDIRRAQVNVEAIIVEVAEGDGVSLGVQWATKAGGTQFNDGITVPITEIGAGIWEAQPTKGSTVCTEAGTCTTNPDQLGDVSSLAASLGKISGAAFGFYGADWAALVQAAANDSRSNLLATPSITTLDNQEAFFIVGEEVPVVTGQTSSSNNDNPFTTVDRREVGVKLKVTPQINEGDAVQLTIEQETSKVQGQTSVDVVFAKRQLQTTVLVDSGDTIILGGLLDDQVEESESKVPLLGDIPVLGHLFRSTGSRKTKRNLMIFIRPTIVRDAVTMRNVTSRKYSQIRAQQLLRDELGVALMPQTKVPVLPEFNSTEDVSPEVQEYLDYLKEKRAREAEEAAKQAGSEASEG